MRLWGRGVCFLFIYSVSVIWVRVSNSTSSATAPPSCSSLTKTRIRETYRYGDGSSVPFTRTSSYNPSSIPNPDPAAEREYHTLVQQVNPARTPRHFTTYPWQNSPTWIRWREVVYPLKTQLLGQPAQLDHVIVPQARQWERLGHQGQPHHKIHELRLSLKPKSEVWWEFNISFSYEKWPGRVYLD